MHAALMRRKWKFRNYQILNALKQLRIVECLLELNNSTEMRKKCGEISSWIFDGVKPGTVQIVNLEKLFLFKVKKNRLIITSYSIENY